MTDATDTRRVSANGVELACSARGTGPLVLYAHGLMSSRAADARRGLVDFSLAGAQRRFVAYDARGHGESSGTAHSQDYTWPVLARDLLALADQLSPDRSLSAIGLSMGTGSLLHAALARPERFERLVLTAPPTAWQARAAQRGYYERQAAFVETHPPDELARLLAATPRAPIFCDRPPPPLPDVPYALLPSVYRGAALSDLPDPAALRSLQLPILILAWDTDPGHPVETATRLAELIPNAQLHISTTSADVTTWGERCARFLA